MVNTIERVDVKGTKVGARLVRLFGLAGVAGLLTALPACSFVVDSNANQCETNTECASRTDGATQCNAEKLCVAPAAEIECTTNKECLDKSQGGEICRKSDFTCQPLKSAECQLVDGDPLRDDAFMFGSILPTNGPDDVYGKPLELAIQLALSDLKGQLSGIPTATPGVTRPLLFIGCSDNSDLEDATALKAAAHLSQVLQVPAIIGESFSGSTLAIANTVTVKEGTLLFSPSATSDTITSLDDNSLVWRTSPPDSFQSAALKLYVRDIIEKAVRDDFSMQLMDPGMPVKVAILHNTDSYGVGLADGVLSSTPTPPLQINGKAVNDPSNMANFERLQYSDTIIDEQVAAADEMWKVFHPNIVLLFGFGEAISIMTTIEAKWIEGGGDPNLRPRYVFPDAVLSSDLSNAVGMDDNLRARVTGTIPGTTNEQFGKFVGKYDLKYSSEKDAYPANTFGAAGAYDIVFLLAYATAGTAIGSETGSTLAEGLKKLSDDTITNPTLLTNAGATSVSEGFKQLLKTDGTINYNGASGPLDFDPDTGEAPSDIQIWCLPKVGMTTGDGRFSNLYFSANPEPGALVGVADACN